VEFVFNCAICCSKLLVGDEKDQAFARKITIHMLDKWYMIPIEGRQIWADIIEAVGFYPYLQKIKDTVVLDDLGCEIRIHNSLSHHLPNTYMHTGQKQLYKYLLSEKNVVASAPTSFGKSLLIEELVASMKYKNIVIIQPTLALLDETRIKLKKYNGKYKIIVRTSQEAEIQRGNLFLLTAERVMEYVDLPNIDLLIIDEFYKLSLKRKDERADILNNAFLKIYDTFSPKFYLLGPNIDGITDGFAEKYNAIFYKTDYSLVDNDVIMIDTKKMKEKEKISQLFELLDVQSTSQTLIYCCSPNKARKLMREYVRHLEAKNTEKTLDLPIIEWLEQTMPHWSLNNALSYGIAVHDGSLPKHVGASIIKNFNEGRIRCIFCTTTIIEGVNTSAKNVVIFDGEKGKNELDYFDFSNIKGRSGRMMEHYLGNIYCFIPIPEKQYTIVDIPFLEQDAKKLPDEILVNIRPEDVQSQVKEKFEKLNETEPRLLKIFKQNSVSISGQLDIYNQLMRDILTEQDMIVWAQFPKKEQLMYALTLCEGKIFTLDKNVINSVNQLTYYVQRYQIEKSLKKIIEDIFKYSYNKLKTKTPEKEIEHYDRAIQKGFHIYRRWFQFTVPKALSVVDNLQRYVCEKQGIQAGSYNYFIQQLENDFISNNLTILIEYGVPVETIRKFEKEIPSDLTEDEVVKYIQQNKFNLYPLLMPYEKERIDECL